MTDRFQATAQAMAAASGLPDYPFLVIPHPIADNDDETLKRKAEAALPEVVRLLTERG